MLVFWNRKDGIGCLHNPLVLLPSKGDYTCAKPLSWNWNVKMKFIRCNDDRQGTIVAVHEQVLHTRRICLKKKEPSLLTKQNSNKLVATVVQGRLKKDCSLLYGRTPPVVRKRSRGRYLNYISRWHLYEDPYIRK